MVPRASRPKRRKAQRRLHLATPVRLLRTLLSAELARLFEDLARSWVADGEPAPALCLSGQTSKDVLNAHNQAFRALFGIPLLARDPPNRSGATAAEVRASRELCALFATPPASVVADPSIEIDEGSRLWQRVLTELAASGEGAHVLMPIDPCAAPLEAFAAGMRGLDVKRAPDNQPWILTVLHSELHRQRPLVVFARCDLMLGPTFPANFGDGDEPIAPPAASTPRDDRLFAARTAGVYVWRVERMPVTIEPRGQFAAVLPAPQYDAGWYRRRIAADGNLTSQSLGILRRLAPHPDQSLMLLRAASSLAAQSGSSLNEAIRHLASGFGLDVPPAAPGPFRPEFINCPEDVPSLLEAAPKLAENAVRLLLWGDPAGGKSRLAVELARRMDPHKAEPLVRITAADILAPRWGDMERRLRAAFVEADRSRVPLLVDEFDAFCAVREPDNTSGNALLIRSSTTEWLRNLDTYPNVPILATVNDLRAIDPAVRRRFDLAIEVKAELSPAAEKLAWKEFFGSTPPDDWRPPGAAIGDYVHVARRCRMLGIKDRHLIEAALQSAKAVRCGTFPHRPSHRNLN